MSVYLDLDILHNIVHMFVDYQSEFSSCHLDPNEMFIDPIKKLHE